MKKDILMVLSFGLIIAAASLTSGCDSCDEDDEAECTTTHNSCVYNCNPLVDYDNCISTCESNYNDCLDEAGCM